MHMLQCSMDTSPTEIYIVTCLQAPTLHAAISARLARCASNMRTAFSHMQEDLDPVVVGGFPLWHWIMVVDAVTLKAERGLLTPTTCALQLGERQTQQLDKEHRVAAAAAEAAAAQRPSKEEQDRNSTVDSIRATLRQHGSVPAMVMPPGSSSMPMPSG